MKNLLIPIILIGGAACLSSPGADIVRQWDFNSTSGDFIQQTGTHRPLGGYGAPARSIGGVGDRFGVVSTATQPVDPNTLDNSHWRIGQIDDPITLVPNPETGFPWPTNGNKTAGVVFPVNTSGYTNINVTWNQENSASASRYWRIQYTVNGTDWLDTTNLITALSLDPNGLETGTPTWQKDLTATFAHLSGVDNNPNFAFRIVSEFESTAIGSTNENYVANRTGSAYGRAGTMWLEMVTVTGDSLDPVNTWPTVSVIPDQIVLTNESTAALPFTITDVETADTSLTVSAQATDTTLISSVVLGGSGGSRTVTVFPAAGQQGTAAVVIKVQDQGGKVTETAFRVTVTVPAIFPIATLVTTAEEAISGSVISTNMPGDPATEWVMSAGSSDQNVVANSGIVFGAPNAASNYVTITPIAGSQGSTTITVTNSGPRGWKAIQSFTLMVLPAQVVYFDLTGLPSTGGAESVTATVVSNGLAASTLTRGTGIGMAGLANGFSANGWNNTNSTTTPLLGSLANAIAQSEYFQFSITVQPGYKLSIASLDHALRRSAIDAPMNYQWQYSLDGFATPGILLTNFNYRGRSSGTAPSAVAPYQWMTTDTAGQNNGNVTWPFLFDHIAALQDVPAGTTITFRLYGWGTGAGADSNTVAVGRFNGPRVRGFVEVAPVTPSLTISRSGADVVVSWPVSATGYTLESTATLSPANWQPSGLTATVVGSEKVVTISNPTGSLFLRLAQ